MSRRPDPAFYERGLRFECTGCGDCCRARGSHNYVYVTLAERRRLARHFRLPTQAFTRRYCEKTDGLFHLRNPASDCEFLDGSRCTVYRARPEQCRTWPFWPENLSRRAWARDVVPGCPGAGVGRLYTRAEIEGFVRRERDRAERG